MSLFKRIFTKSPTQPDWTPTHQHHKGGFYRVLTEAVLESDRTPVIVYDDKAGKTWVRPAHEFHDGRFTKLHLTIRAGLSSFLS